jgi:uncharacterized membrane protein
MSKTRLEAFSDGVIAIIITIMVIELRAPHGADWSTLRPLLPVLLSYVLSFVYIGIYWNNHHHLLHATRQISGGAMWANMHLLFWLSLVPFVTAWMGENEFARNPAALYGVVMLMAAVAYAILVRVLLKHHDRDSALARAIGSDAKGNASLALYLLGIVSSWISPSISLVFYVVVAVIWLVPDRRIERALQKP